MPTYRYRCEDCGTEFTLRRRLSRRNDEAECSECGSVDTRRIITGFSVGSGSSGGASA